MDNLLKYNDMKYNDIIKGSKFYLPINLNLGYLLKDTEIILLMHLIHYSELGIKVSIPSLVKFTARSETTIKRTLKKLRTLKLVSEDGYKPCLEQIALVYDSVNAAKSVKYREAWCNAYTEAEGQIEPLKKCQSDTLGLGQNEPLKEGQNEPPKKGQFEPPYKEDVYNEDLYKEDSYNEYFDNEDSKYNTNNILKEKKPSKENKVNRNSLREDFEILTEEVKENQNETKSQIEGNDDSLSLQPLEKNPSSGQGVKDSVEAIPRELRGCSEVVRQLYTNSGGNLHTVLQELAASKPSEFRNLVVLLERNNVSEDTKELAASLASFWGIKLY